jgi:hypothetical protein
MFGVAINQRRHRDLADDVDPAADQREILLGKIDHPWRLGDAPVDAISERIWASTMPPRTMSDGEGARSIDVALPETTAATAIEAASARHENCVSANRARGRRMPTAVSTRVRRPGGGASRGRCSRTSRCSASMRAHSAANAGSVAIRSSTARALVGSSSPSR